MIAFDLAAFERPRILRAANRYLDDGPVTVTAATSPRSAGGRHDDFSEGDYWWPDPQNPSGPYIQRDGESNPGNFLAHRAALMRLSVHVPALVAAWQVTQEQRYSDHARRHLRAWFTDAATRMTPHLLYAQAVQGRFTGSFPKEMRRTKPYGYHLFNLDGMAMVCEILSTRQENLWTFTLPDGRGIRKALTFMVPFIADKKRWPHKPDVTYFDEWPVRQPALWFGGHALNEPGYIELWKKLSPDPTVEEVIRNYFIRQPVLWQRS